MIVLLAALCIIAPLLLLFVNPQDSYNPVTTSMQDYLVLPRLAATAAVAGGALLWGAVLLSLERWPRVRWPALIWVPALAFVAINVLALIFAEDWRQSLMGEHLRYQGLLPTLTYVLLFAVAALAVRTTRDLRWVLLALFVGGLGTAIYALVQKAGWDWNEWQFQEINRPFSTMGQANILGAFLVATIGACLFLLFTAKDRWRQAGYAAGLTVMAFALLFTVSRSAYLASGVVILVWGAAALRWWLPGVWRERPEVAVALATAVALPVVLAFVAVFFTGLPQGRVAIFSNTNDQAADQRLSLWRLSWEMTVDRPLLGHGQDGFSVEFPSYRDRPDLPGIRTKDIDPESSHNFFLDLATGTGVAGLLSFLALLGGIFWHAGRRALRTDDTHLRVALVALSSAVLGYLAAITFGFSEAITTWLLWLLLGALAGLVAKAAPQPEPQPGTDDSAPDMSTLASGLGAIGLAVAAVAVLSWAASIVAADLAAGQSQNAYTSGDEAAAVRFAHRASTLNPINQEYLLLEGRMRENAFVSGPGPTDVADIVDTYEKAVTRFKPRARPLLSFALAREMLAGETDAPLEYAVFPILEQAVEADPYNRSIRDFVADFYEQRGYAERAYPHRVAVACWSRPDC